MDLISKAEPAEPLDAAAPAGRQAPGRTIEGQRLPLVGHLDELRRRLWVCVLGVTLAAVASFGWAGRLIEWLKRPAGEALPTLAFFSPPEAVLAHLKVAVTMGLVLCLPLLLYQLWGFVRPGLTPQERRYGLAFVWWGTGLFLAGAAFAYWFLLPLSLRFLLTFGGGALTPVISISQYLAFTVTVLLACGAVFELPLAICLLAKIGIVRAATLRRKWRHAVLVMALVAAVLTPTTDVATMVLMVAPMLVLYEVSIWVARLAEPRRQGNG